MKHIITAIVVCLASSAFAQGKPVADEKRQATVIKTPGLEVTKPKPTQPNRPRGEYLYVWDDVDGGSHRDVVTATGRFSPGDCDNEELYEVRHPTYTHWVARSELRRIQK